MRETAPSEGVVVSHGERGATRGKVMSKTAPSQCVVVSHARRAWSSSRPAAYVGEGVAWCSSACRKVRELKVVKESGGGTSPQHEVYPLAM